MLRSNHLLGSLAALCTSFLMLAGPLVSPALGQPNPSDTKPEDAKAADAKGGEDPVAKVKELNRVAMQYFDDLNYAMAEKSLLEALAIVEKSNLGNGPAGLATNGNLAVLYSDGFKQPDKAVAYFKKALAIKPDLRLSKQRATPESDANLARAKAELGGGAGAAAAAPPGGTGAPGEEGGDLRCPTGGEVAAGDEITLRCLTASTLQPATIMLYYKTNAAQEYEVQRMSKEGVAGGTTTWVVKFPAPRTEGSQVLFYIEANDPSGNSLATSGSEDSPSVIAVKGGEAAAVTGPPPEGEEEEEEGEEEEEEEGIDDNNPLAALERERWREHEGLKGTWLFSLGVGSGFGYAAGHATEAFGRCCGVGFTPGLAPALLGQAVWEVGYFVGRKTALSIGGRHQWIPGLLPGAATGAHSVLVRSLFFTEGEGRVRWYFACAVGAGEGFRLEVVATRTDEGHVGEKVKDTVRGGPFLAGIGGGMLYKLGRRWHWSVDTQLLMGFGNISAVLDLTTGVRWQY